MSDTPKRVGFRELHRAMVPSDGDGPALHVAIVDVSDGGPRCVRIARADPPKPLAPIEIRSPAEARAAIEVLALYLRLQDAREADRREAARRGN